MWGQEDEKGGRERIPWFGEQRNPGCDGAFQKKVPPEGGRAEISLLEKESRGINRFSHGLKTERGNRPKTKKKH